MLKETIAAVLRELTRHRIPFVFFGMEALNIHLGRAGLDTFGTEDSDFLFDPALSTPAAILKILRRTAFPEQVFITWKEPAKTTTVFDGQKWKSVRCRGAGTLSIQTPEGYYHIDLAFGDAGIRFGDIWQKSAGTRLYGVPIRIASKDHILKMKRRAGREKDVRLLERLDIDERSKRPTGRRPKLEH